MEEYIKYIKGQKGVSKKYKLLGETKSMKVPLSVYDKIKHILSLLEEIQNLDKVHKILDNAIIGLEKNLNN
jgi:hypothetical protein